nr:hypothetical protein BaRGS_016790 [Batillaria attramentaria]
MYNTETGVFSIRETGIYAVSLRPCPAINITFDFRYKPDLQRRIEDSLSLILKNKTNHELLTVVAKS